MSQTPELLPCPWCHEKPSLTSGYSQQGATVECVQEKCPLNPGAYVNARPGENSSLLIDEARQEAIRKWNTRAQPAVDEAVEAVDKLLIHAKRNDDNKFHHWNRMEELAEIIRTTLAQSTQSPVEQPPQTVAGDSFFDGKDYSAALGKIEYLLNQERQHLSFMTEENQPDYFLDPIKQDIASYEAAIELIKQAALTRHEGA